MGEDGEKNAPAIIGQVTDILGAGKVTDRMLTMLERGLGPVLRPLSDRWANRNQRIDAERWLTSLRAQGLEAVAGELTIYGRAALRLTVEKVREQENREAIAAEGVIQLQQIAAELPPNDGDELPEVDLEWLDHFWELAGRISLPGRQRILARTALGRTTSARALTILSTLSGEEARELERLARYACRFKRGDHSGFGLIKGTPDCANQAIQAVNTYLVMMKQPLSQRLFGSIGVFVEDGWAYSFSQRPINGEICFAIAGRDFRLRGRAGPIMPAGTDHHGFVGFGSGVEISPIGDEIFDLINVEPDEEWLACLAEAYSHHDWVLCRRDGSSIQCANNAAC